jgi:DNA-binding NarL/FixJ family response regulator
MKIRVLITDDQSMVRAAPDAASDEQDIEVVAEARETGLEAVARPRGLTRLSS